MAKKATGTKGPRKAGGMAARARQKATERENQFSGSGVLKFPSGEKPEFFKPKKGNFNLDIMPYEVTIAKHPEGIPVGEKWFRRDYYAHRNIGIEEQAVICPKTIGKKCPICEEYAVMKSDKDADEDMVKALKASLRQLYNVIDLDDAKKGVQLWDMSEFLFGRLLDEELREGPEEYGAFAELEGGYTLEVRFKEDSYGGNSFSKASKIDFEERKDYKAKYLEQAHDLDALLKVLSYEEIYNLHHGIEDDEVEGAEEEEEEQTSHDRPEPEPEEEEEAEEEAADEDKFDDMDRGELKKFIKDEELDIKVTKSKTEDDLRDLIREALAEEPEEEAEEEPEEEETGDEFDDMDRAALKKHIKKNDLEIKVTKSKTDDDLRDAIRDASDDGAGETADGECPFGYTFGEDCDEFDECTECDAWETCEEKQQELKAAKRGKGRKK